MSNFGVRQLARQLVIIYAKRLGNALADPGCVSA